jgi:arginine-tRNA-protein transferase
MQRRGDALLRVKIGEPVIDQNRVRLFNLHRDVRGLSSGDSALDHQSYAEFLTDTCCHTVEFSYWHENKLVAVAIADLGQVAVSAVYCFYDPAFKLLSLGTYSVLREIEFCRETGRRYLYLGFFIAESPHMSYKARFRPHQRLVDGIWTEFY